jgi:hypothetical protein
MPKVSSTSQSLQPFICHGVGFSWEEGGTTKGQGNGDCPFCGKEGKFWVAGSTGLWDCKSCGEKGNPTTFLRSLWQRAKDWTKWEELLPLAKERRLLSARTLQAWGVCRSPLTGQWLVPGHGPDPQGKQAKLNQLYRWVEVPGKVGRRRLWPTQGMPHCLHGVHLYDKRKPVVYLCEGPWDAMALWEVLGRSKQNKDGTLSIATNEQDSMLASANVLAVPGANVFSDAWRGLFAGKDVYLMYDSDYPRKHPQSGALLQPVGWAGMRRVTEALAAAGDQPSSISCLHWRSGSGYDPELPDCYDVRDFLSDATGKTAIARVPRLAALLSLLGPVPADWVPGRGAKAVSNGEVGLETLPCSSWASLLAQWRKTVSMDDRMELTLAAMLACSASTDTRGDQLWVKVVGPPSSGKSMFAEALSVARKYVLPKDTVTGLFSGFSLDRNASEDYSLAAKIKGKTLIIKDGDTILTAPNRSQILSQFRALYDRAVRTSYGNAASREYEGLNATVIFCGTESLRELDTSELGERMVDVVIVDRIDHAREMDVALRVVRQAAQDMCHRSNGKADSQDGPERVKAKQMTGGYVKYLRENVHDLLGRVADSSDGELACARLGKFVSYMRARPSAKQKEKAQRELCYRLSVQFIRLAKCLTVVLNRSAVDATVVGMVRQVALDTARGRTVRIAEELYKAGEDGVECRLLAMRTQHDEAEERGLLGFLRRLKAAEVYMRKIPGVQPSKRWRLTPLFRELYRQVMEE